MGREEEVVVICVGGELRGLGLRGSPSLKVENLDGDSAGRDVGKTYGENRWVFTAASEGDFGDKGREFGKKGEEDIELGVDVLTMAASRAGL